MMINKDNYELYALDYIEGNLDEIAIKEMALFLDQNPSIQAELELIGLAPVLTPNEQIVYEPKSELKKPLRGAIWFPQFMKYAAAAIVLMALFAVWFLNQNKVETDNLMSNAPNLPAEQEQIAETPVTEGQIAQVEETIIPEKEVSSKEIKAQAAPIINTSNKVVASQVNPNNDLNNTAAPVTVKKDIPETPQIITEVPDITIASIPANNLEEVTTDPITRLEAITEVASISGVSIEPFAEDLKDPLALPMNLTAASLAEMQDEQKKGSWLLNAITKKADGSQIFAFTGIKRALTPTRYRDENVDKSSTGSPIKQLTDD